MPDTEEKDPYAYTVPITLAAIKVEEPETYWLKDLRGYTYQSDGGFPRFSGKPRRYSIVDICTEVFSSIDPHCAKYEISIKFTDPDYRDLSDPDFTGKINFTSVEIINNEDQTTIARRDKPIYTHVYNRRNKCLEPNMVFEFTEETVIIHDHLTQTEYNALLEL